jgi:hypothetical protein
MIYGYKINQIKSKTVMIKRTLGQILLGEVERMPHLAGSMREDCPTAFKILRITDWRFLLCPLSNTTFHTPDMFPSPVEEVSDTYSSLQSKDQLLLRHVF